MTKLEKFLIGNKNTIQFLGIITALITLFFTCNNTRQTKKSIELAYKQYEEMVTPIWQISVINETNNIDNEKINILSNNSSIVLNSVNVYYLNNENLDSLTILKTENWNSNIFKKEILNEISNYYVGDQFFWAFYSCIPVCIDFSYYQHGKAKSIKALYKLNIRIYLQNENTKISLKSFEFIKYFDNLSESDIKEELEEFNYNYCYKSCCKESFINTKKTKIIEQDKYLNEILNYSSKFQMYIELSVIFQNDSTKNTKIIYPKFIINDSLFSEIKTKQEYIIRNRRHYSESVYRSFINMKNYLDTVVYPGKNDYNQIINTKWNKERNETLRRYNRSLIDSLYANIIVN